MCRKLNIARSSYYQWLNRKETKGEIEKNELALIIKEYDERLDHILGYRRMTHWINRLNHKNYNQKRVRRMMRLLGIHSIIRRKKPKYHQSTPEITAENLLKRDFVATKPNEKWVTDVTEFKIKGTGKKVYLSAILDVYDRSIVAYRISSRNDNNLVLRTFEKAMELNQGATPLFHSDRGFQYTSTIFRTILEDNGIIQSMSRVGRCIDNGPIEGFWGIIKAEMYYLYKFDSRELLESSIHKYIDFYNNKRFQKRFKNKTPMEVRWEALNTTSKVIQYPIPENNRIKKYYASFSKQDTSCPTA